MVLLESQEQVVRKGYPKVREGETQERGYGTQEAVGTILQKSRT